MINCALTLVGCIDEGYSSETSLGSAVITVAVDVINAKTLTSIAYLACLKRKCNYTYSEDIVFNWIFSFGEALVGSGASASVKKLYENKDSVNSTKISIKPRKSYAGNCFR